MTMRAKPDILPEFVLSVGDLYEWLATVPPDEEIGPYVDIFRCFAARAAAWKFGTEATWGVAHGNVYYDDDRTCGYQVVVQGEEAFVDVLHAFCDVAGGDYDTTTKRQLVDAGVAPAWVMKGDEV